LDRSESAHLQELGSLGSVYEDAKESKREAPDEEEEGDWKNHKALEALRTTKLAPMVQQFFDGKAGADALAGALGIPLSELLTEEANRAPEPEGIAEDRPIEEEG
jgi:hypothetical protein